MVEIVTFAIPLHHVRAFLVVDVLDLVPCVGTHALAVEPRGVRPADAVVGQTAEVGETERFRGYAWSVTQDAAAGGRGEHSVAEAVDEVGGCGCFGEGGDEVLVDVSGRLVHEMNAFGMLASSPGIDKSAHR